MMATGAEDGFGGAKSLFTRLRRYLHVIYMQNVIAHAQSK